MSGSTSLRIVFVCVENANRSQMAEAFARIIGRGRLDAYSAGSKGGGQVNPRAVASMARVGYDLSSHTSKSLVQLPPIAFDVAVMIGCGDACPTLRAARRIDWEIPDPRHMEPREFDEVRDQIGVKVRALLGEMLDQPT